MYRRFAGCSCMHYSNWECHAEILVQQTRLQASWTWTLQIHVHYWTVLVCCHAYIGSLGINFPVLIWRPSNDLYVDPYSTSPPLYNTLNCLTQCVRAELAALKLGWTIRMLMSKSLLCRQQFTRWHRCKQLIGWESLLFHYKYPKSVFYSRCPYYVRLRHQHCPLEPCCIIPLVLTIWYKCCRQAISWVLHSDEACK